jgi:hypothetical protein
MSVSIIANKQNILTLHSIIDNKEETGIEEKGIAFRRCTVLYIFFQVV